jgi:murein lipoprotein
MMKIVKITAALLVAGLATGCASTSDIDNLQVQIDGLKSQISTASSDAAKAQASAADAAAKAAAAEAAANRAAQYAQDTNSKLDRMFKKSMMK